MVDYSSFQLLESGPGFEIYLDAQSPCILNVFVVPQTSAELRFQVEQILKHYREHSTRFPNLGYISDNRRMGAFSPEDIDWATSYFTPTIMGYGLRGMAFIVPDDIFAQINIDDFTQASADQYQFIVRYFNDLQVARQFVQALAAKTAE
jgi:hypothetical protein